MIWNQFAQVVQFLKALSNDEGEMDNTGKHTGVVRGESRADLSRRFQRVRACTETLCQPLCTEDYVIQTMPDVSPTKWHLAHTSWFFEAFLLAEHQPAYASPDPLYSYLFNSYYIQIGERFHRPHRGLLSRPTVDEIYVYRRHVDEAVLALLDTADEQLLAKAAPVVILGLQHEQQHQELLLTDIKHVLSVNPMHPVYAGPAATDAAVERDGTGAAVPPMTASGTWCSHPWPQTPRSHRTLILRSRCTRSETKDPITPSSWRRAPLIPVVVLRSTPAPACSTRPMRR